MDEKNRTGVENPAENPTFDQLTTEEKRRLISALSMGRLDDTEKRELADMVRRSRLTDAEKAQISRAFAMSRLSDEERRALIARRQQEKTAAVHPETSAPAETPAAASATQGADAASVSAAAEENRNVSLSPNAAIHDSEEERTRAHTVLNEDTASHNRDSAGLTRSVTIPVKRVSDSRTPQRSTAGKKPRYEEEDRRESDTTAITSLLKGIVYIVAVLVISVFASWTIVEIANDVFAFSKSDEVVTVVIEEEMTANDVAQMLFENGIIKYPTMYELFIRLKEESTEYLVGEYEISPSMNYGDINDAFTYIAHTREQVVVTVPEGYTVDQIIDLLLKNGIGTREGFVAAINEFDYGYRFMEGLDNLDPERTYRLEGYLFPDTYYFFKDASEIAVIDKFLVNFERKVSEEYYERADVLGMSMDDLVILASMIQAEGMTLTDFENISSVFHNRLASPRTYPKMQSDATLQYILDKRKTALTAADLQIDSKYNSYMYNGLPPGSICNPGIDAINCALYPAETDYYYFLADGRGNTYFSKTLEEHEVLKKQYIDNQ